jgi:hypothetical protein
VRRFQRWAGLAADGRTRDGARFARRHRRCTGRLVRPLAPIGDPFGPRGARFHPGIDLRPRRRQVEWRPAWELRLVGRPGRRLGLLVVIAPAAASLDTRTVCVRSARRRRPALA